MSSVVLPADMSGLLQNKVILITGAAGALGRVAAQACAEAEASVVMLDKDVPGLERARDDILAQHPQASLALFPLDLAGAMPEHYQQLAETLAEHYAVLDGLLHNAVHMEYLEPFACQTPERWFHTLQVNLNAPFLLTKALLPLLQNSEEASVVFTSDSSAREARAYWGAYGVSKVGVEALAKILASEWEAGGRLRANVLLPGPVRTPIRYRAFPGENEKDLTAPQSLAKLYVYLLGSASKGWSGQTFTFQDEKHVLRTG